MTEGAEIPVSLAGRRERLGRALADSLSLSRIAFATLILYVERSGRPLAAFLLFLALDASDILDGAAARKFGCPSAKGAALDCGVDFVVLLALVAYRVRAGDLPLLLPILIVLSFGSFVLKNLRLGGPSTSGPHMGSPKGTALAPSGTALKAFSPGKHTGTVLYFLLTLAAAARAFFPGFEAPATAVALLVAELTLCASLAENAVTLLRRQRGAWGMKSAKIP